MAKQIYQLPKVEELEHTDMFPLDSADEDKTTKHCSLEQIDQYISKHLMPIPDYSKVTTLQAFDKKTKLKNNSKIFKIKKPCFIQISSCGKTDTDGELMLLATNEHQNLIMNTTTHPQQDKVAILYDHLENELFTSDMIYVPVPKTKELYIRLVSDYNGDTGCIFSMIAWPFLGDELDYEEIDVNTDASDHISCKFTVSSPSSYADIVKSIFS